MPTYYARSTGNINAAIWATTPTGTAGSVTFDPSDILVANSFTISVNVSVTVAEVRADTLGGATAGGIFALGNGVTLTANVNGVGSTANGMVQAPSTTTNATIVGNITCGSANCVRLMATNGTLNIIGSVTGGTGAAAVAYDGLGNSVINITGNVTGGTGANAFGVNTITSGGTINITGTVTGGSGSASNGANLSTAGTYTITGNAVGGSVGLGVLNGGAGTLNLIGVAIGAGAAGVSVTSATGTVTATRARGGALATSAVGIANGTTGSIASVSEIEYGDAGASPTSGPIRLTDATTNVAVMFRFGTTKKTLVDTASTALIPAASNVRSGITYNAGQTTGTCAVPGAASVLVGVPVDNTVGTASVSSAAIQSACDAALSAFSSGRLGNVATVASTGQQLANALTP